MVVSRASGTLRASRLRHAYLAPINGAKILGCEKTLVSRTTQSIQSAIFYETLKKEIFLRNLRMSETRRFERPRSSRSQHSNPGGASCLSSASLAQIIAAAPPGFECCERELLGRSKRRVSGMRKFRKQINFLGSPKVMGIGCSGNGVGTSPP